MDSLGPSSLSNNELKEVQLVRLKMNITERMNKFTCFIVIAILIYSALKLQFIACEYKFSNL